MRPIFRDLVCCAAAVTLSACQPASDSQAPVAPGTIAPAAVPEFKPLAPAVELPLQVLTPDQVAAKARQSVVLVRTPGRKGAGFIIRPDGLIATSYQLIRGADVIGVKLKSGDIYPVTEIVAHDPLKNLALLRISGYMLPVVNLQDSDTVSASHPFVVVTSPENLVGTVVAGTAAGVRDISEIDPERKGHKVIELDAALPAEGQGAPVLDLQGRAIGVATTYAEDRQSRTLAIPSNYLAGLVNNPQPIALNAWAGKTAPVRPTAAAAPLSKSSGPVIGAEKSFEPAKNRKSPARSSRRRIRDLRNIYIAPGRCGAQLTEGLLDEDIPVSRIQDKADATLALDGTVRVGCTMLGCGRKIMRYRVTLQDRDDALIWQRSSEEDSMTLEEICEDIADDVAEALADAR